MDNQQILAAMQLSEHELKELVKKTNHYFNSLNHEEKRLFNNTQKSPETAAAALSAGGVSITGEQLEEFLRAYGQDPAIRCFWCRKAFHGNEESPAR